MRVPVLLFIMLFATQSIAQTYTNTYIPDTSVQVIVNGQSQIMPWCGGFNNPQFAVADLNNDGLGDLVVFEPNLGVKTFINTGSPGDPRYVYAPEYALNFPPVLRYMIMADYNRDGVPDLFDGGYNGYLGFAAFQGYYNASNQLCFNFYKILYYDNDSSVGFSPIIAFSNPGDIPAIVDVDNDSDLDFLVFDIDAGFVTYYRNMQVELGLPKDSIVIALEDQCWGKFYQGFYPAFILQRTCNDSNLYYLDTSYYRTMGHPGNSLCLFDYDMDGDYDVLDGNISFNSLTFLLNGRVETHNFADTMVWQDSMWQSSFGATVWQDTLNIADTTHVNLPYWPAAFNVDIDQDGSKDLLISPNGSPAENYFCVNYYKNYTTPWHPDWRFQSDSFLVDQSIDIGTAAYPAFFDYSKHGLKDLFVGSDGYYNAATGTLVSRISWYRNTSTPGNPSLTLMAKDFMNLDTFNFAGAAPAFGDIDNDGITDMLIGHTDGTISYFKNMAASDSVTPVWQLAKLALTDASGNVIQVDSGTSVAGHGHAAPFIYDIDKDGLPDLVIGDYFGYLAYYRNVSTTPGVISLQLINTQLGHIRVDPDGNFAYGPNYSTPYIGPIDTTGVEYLLMGSNSGNIYRFTGFQTGDTTATYTQLDSGYCGIDSSYSLYNHPRSFIGVNQGLRSAPAVADIPGDGSFDMLVGELRGGVEFYRYNLCSEGVPKRSVNSKINVYPNPARDKFYISWDNMTGKTIQVTLTTMQGQPVYTTTAPVNDKMLTIPLTGLSSGVYICMLQCDGNKYYKKVTVVK